MKRIFLAALAIMLVPIMTAHAFAAGVTVNGTFTPQSMRHTTSTVTDAEAAFFNPGGFGFADPGLYATAANFLIFDRHHLKDASADTDYRGSSDIYLFPAASVSFVADEWAAFLCSGVIGGGGSATYNHGSEALDSNVFDPTGFLTTQTGQAFTPTKAKVSGSSASLHFTLGGAYEVIKDMLSFSAAGRFVSGAGSSQIEYSAFMNVAPANTVTSKVETEEKAKGYGYVVSIATKPTKELSISLKYESAIIMEWENEVVTNEAVAFNPAIAAGLIAQTAATDGVKKRKDIPAVGNIGISYKITPEVEVGTGFGYTFQKMANLSGDQENHIDDAWSVTGSVEVTVMKGLKVGFVHSYSDNGTHNTGESAGLAEAATYPWVISDSIGIGWEVMPGLIVEVGYAYQWYGTYTEKGHDFENSNTRNAFGFGVQYKFL
ncbi:MAG: hypothetical protein EPN93_16630 [Spirochaetes bacterium]|nr:MAG: hypothetical protein EPN93_16630 [Spirochaetota bacterium]